MENEASPLSDSALRTWLAGRGLSGLYAPMRALESRENWTRDASESQFAKAVDRFAVAAVEAEAHGGHIESSTDEWIEDLVHVFAYIRTANCIRLLAAVNKLSTGFADGLLARLSQGSPTPESHVIASRILFLVRRECYFRIFDESRRKAVLVALANMES